MARQTINLGTPPSGTDGDTTRVGFTKANANFTELYQALREDFISGLQLNWSGAQSISISPGAAYIPGAMEVVPVNASISKAGISLAANSWAHVYLESANDIIDVIVSATGPASPYYGTARTQAGNAYRRYLGSIRVDALGAIVQFRHTPSAGRVTYMSLRNADLAGGVATVPTNVSLAQTLPLTAVAADLMLSLDALGAYLTTGVPGMSNFGGNNYLGYLQSSAQVSIAKTDNHPVDGSQQIAYRLSANPTAGSGAYVRVMGYIFER